MTIIPLTVTGLIDWISIGVDLLTGGGIAAILAYVVPRKLNDDRKLKDFFIDEFCSIKNEYNDFCKEMCLGKLSAQSIKETFKQLNLKLDDIQSIANRNLKLHINLLDELSNTQVVITGSDEMNEQYKNSHIKFSTATHLIVCQKQDVFNRNIISAIVTINGA